MTGAREQWNRLFPLMPRDAEWRLVADLRAYTGRPRTLILFALAFAREYGIVEERIDWSRSRPRSMYRLRQI